MRGLSREELRIREVARRTCTKPRDYNAMRDMFADLGIEHRTVDGRTWILCDDRVLELLGRDKGKETEGEI